MTLPRSANHLAPRRATATIGAALGRRLAVGLALLTTLPSAAHAADLEIRSVNRSRQPHSIELASVGDLDAGERCTQASDCRCAAGVEPACRDHRCRCVWACLGDEKCRDGERCREGRCRATAPLTALWIAVGALGLLTLGLVALLGLSLRARAGQRPRPAEAEPERRDAVRRPPSATTGATRGGDEEEPRTAATGDARLAADDGGTLPAPVGDPDATERARPPTAFRLRAQAPAQADIPLAEGETVFGGDRVTVLEAVHRLPPGSTGHPAVLAAVTVSGKHAVVHVASGSVSVTDLGSTNGTFVNGERVKPHAVVALEPGDRVAFSRQADFVLEAICAEIGG